VSTSPPSVRGICLEMGALGHADPLDFKTRCSHLAPSCDAFSRSRITSVERPFVQSPRQESSSGDETKQGVVILETLRRLRDPRTTQEYVDFVLENP